MRILFLSHSFNSLTQRLWDELSARGHQLSLELDIADAVTEEAVDLFRPDLIVAPFLKRAIPESVWSRLPCLVLHPGIPGDRGPSALDWAIQEGEAHWGVTLLQAEAEMDAGPIWAHAGFPLRRARKSSLYRQEVTEAACAALLEALDCLERGEHPPQPPRQGRLRPLMKQEDRRVDWQRDDTTTILARIHAADGFPGLADALFGIPCRLFDAWPEDRLHGEPGTLLARRETALCRATRDGALWLGHGQREGGIKLPATVAFAAEAATLPEVPLSGWWAADHATWQDIRYEEADGVGTLHFEFYNGAMGTDQCRRLQAAFTWACTRPTRVIVLAGGEDYWSNGIHLNLIEAANASPADESWANINAMDDLAEALLRCQSHLTIAALAGNAGAGGCFLARCADQVWLRSGVMLNPHYKNMGNLYGSEFWTYLLPPRVGVEGARRLMQQRLPLSAREAVASGLYDACLAADRAEFRAQVQAEAASRASAPDLPARLEAKAARRAADEAIKPLAQWRAEELEEMRRNFYGFDPSYHYARHQFVHKVLPAWTPRHLARHREG
ncbi:enoyl-CoA hydratase-related protein [Denitratisoma oestradiolicum]|uniref:Hydrogenase maturation factor HoxX n=1 Tax=Denitratisoma oestradiolicum TaxID=311182 RepID=A0A6S6XXR0_9PROT|nr:enoyl-CoA hydratase-related protein [Denitratisoma oestradiolicum]TWO81818.1 hydrogenase maturation protein [Denitratisoma oestradiolicum]CAB1370784.1 Hydrogenase maturation factor HoxX [Denitratisoma oestradiolicum]